MAKTKVNIKLLVDTKANRVLFAEASKDFVDFLVHILSLPIGTVIKILSTKGMVGCLGDLYHSFETLSTDYLQPNVNLNSILKPSPTVLAYSSSTTIPLLLDSRVENHAPESFSAFSFSTSNHRYVSNFPSAVCPSCNRSMAFQVGLPPSKVGSSTGAGASSVGFVKGVVTYMVMDTLEVKPMSTVSGIAVMNKFDVKDVSCLVEKQVEVGSDEGIALLKASLESRAVLTTVFLGNKL